MRIPCALVILLVTPAVLAAAEAPDDAARLARRARAVLEQHCYRCHGQNGVAEGGFNYVLDLRKLVERRQVTPGAADKSKLLKRMRNTTDPMPPLEEQARPTQADLDDVRNWIAAGAAAADAAVEPRKFLALADMLEIMRLDLSGLQERERPFIRYFTLTHLHNAGLSADELQSYRHGLSKLVNSLSWGSRVVVPQPIDAEKTIFRIDLRDHQWNERIWEKIVERYPYGVVNAGEAARYVAEATRCRLPFVRGDWFVAAAAQPPLYHDLLQLPGTELELEKMLRVDVAENIRQERVIRAGFNSSGVSRNNRLIERHEAGGVVYWKSYDFAANTGAQNLFARPLGPGAEAGCFRHDGGEIIFSLPNGLQAYLLVDAAGRRIDKGPAAIVSDPRRPDRAVVNGLSCMSCHAKGVIDKADQVREHALRNLESIARGDRDVILALYPPRERFRELVQRDAQRFQEAVAKTGAPLSATEPVAALAQRFEAELDLALTAAEAGVRPKALLAALDQSPQLAKELGPLRIQGGTVQRQVFVDAFGELVRVLRLGEIIDPVERALARLILAGDQQARAGHAEAARRTYTQALALDPNCAVVLVRRGDLSRQQGNLDAACADYDRAVALDPMLAAAFNNRGLLRRAQGRTGQAIADFTRALEIDPQLASAHHNRGAARFAQGEHARAIADYDQALRLEPGAAVSCNNRGLAHFALGQLDSALADYDKAISLAPDFAVAFYNRGLVRSRQNQHARAVADFDEAIRLDPKFARAYLSRSRARDKLGDAAGASADRTFARALDPGLETETE